MSQDAQGDRWVEKRSRSRTLERDGRHAFQHWRRDNQVYFITACCRDHFPAFASEGAKAIFWDRFEHWTSRLGFTPFVTTLLDNHYHTLGHLRRGADLPRLMQFLHGSVAKLVNDLLETRRAAFWRDRSKGQEYFDGCIRDEVQCRRAFGYTLTQAVRAGLVRDWHQYPHTRVTVELERAVKRSLERDAFLQGVRYKRYDCAGRASAPRSQTTRPAR